jgi:hypothetical protein
VEEEEMTRNTEVPRLVRDITLVIRHALDFPWADAAAVAAEAGRVRKTVDEVALARLIRAILAYIERHGYTWESEREVVAACERLEDMLASVRTHREEIRRRLATG